LNQDYEKRIKPKMKADLDSGKPSFIHEAFSSNSAVLSKFTFFPFELASYANSPERLNEVQKFIDRENTEGKRTIFYFAHDNDHPISEFLSGNPIVFRNSMSRNFEYVDEFIIPTRVDNFRESARNVAALGWEPIPKVSFMGWAVVARPITDKKVVKGLVPANGLIASMVFPTPPSIGTVLRKKAIELIESDLRINSNFMIHDRYFHHYTEGFQKNNLQDYVKSMRDTHYVLTIRGCGNYSIRLFETLAIGRIPIMVDTNQFLPFEDDISWKDIGVWVPFENFKSISEYIYSFHSNLDQESFDQHTSKILKIYEDHLTRPAVIRKIERILERLM